MLILTCILILKHWWMKYRWLSAILVAGIVFLLVILVRRVYHFIENRNNIENEEYIDISEFSNILEMDKEWKILSYPEITLLSDMDGEIVSMNVITWDIVSEYEILMQISNWINSDYDVDNIDAIYDDYKQLDWEYSKFKREYGDEIKKLESELYNKQSALVQSMEFKDSESMEILKKEIEDINSRLELLKTQKEELEISVRDLESEIWLVRSETDKYYTEAEKQTPRAPFNGVIWSIYVNEWQFVNNWDKLITLINNNYTPEIEVDLDFDEYLLTENLTWVVISIQNENWWDFYYNGEIYSRSPVLNEEWKYTIIVKILEEDVSDLILSDDNTRIDVIFWVNSDLIWVPDRCFKKIRKTNGVLSLYDGYFVEDKEVEIKYKWNGWNNIEKNTLYSLENESEKYGIELLCDIE